MEEREEKVDYAEVLPYYRYLFAVDNEIGDRK